MNDGDNPAGAIAGLEARLPSAAGGERVKLLVELSERQRDAAPAASLARARQAVAAADGAAAEQGAAHDCLGAALERTDDHRGAIEHYRIALAAYTESGDRRAMATVLNSLGNNYYHISDHHQALRHYERSLEIKRELGDSNGVSGLSSNIGSVHFHLNQYETALEHYLAALRIAEDNGNKRGLAYFTNNVGLVYKCLGEHEKALEYHQRSLAIKEELGEPRAIAGSLGNIGVSYGLMRDYPRAQEYHQRALQIAEQAGDKMGIGICLTNLGDVRKTQGDLSGALAFYRRSLALRREIGDGHGTAETLINMGDLCLRLRDADGAAALLGEGLELAGAIAAKGLTADGHRGLADLAEARGDFRAALEHYRRHVDVKDSIFTEESSRKIAEMRTRYETEKKEREAEIYRLRNVELVAANRLISEAKSTIEEKNRQIMSSIQYAQRIQRAVLPAPALLRRELPDHFVIYRPKDVVSGDFYWLSRIGARLVVAVVDCTGHGVPGAFMSMIGNMLLNEIVNERGICDPAMILEEMHRNVRSALKQEGGAAETTDGMDAGICAMEGVTLTFAGAGRPLYHVGRSGVRQIPGDRTAIGGRQKEAHRSFANREVAVAAGDTVYLTTDGYVDQPDPEDRRYGTRRFEALLAANGGRPIAVQERELIAALSVHQGPAEQRDDITVLGWRVL